MIWENINIALPEIIYEEGGSVNSVLVRWKTEHRPECGSDYIVANTLWVVHSKDQLTHWQYITAPKIN